MMGQHDRSEALFYYIRLEDQVPENHLLRLIEKHISFEFVCERLRAGYSETGRPSIDPEPLLRIVLICTASPTNANWWRNCACASGVALVHRSRLRSRDPTSLHVVEKPAPP